MPRTPPQLSHTGWYTAVRLSLDPSSPYFVLCCNNPAPSMSESPPAETPLQVLVMRLISYMMEGMLTASLAMA